MSEKKIVTFRVGDKEVTQEITHEEFAQLERLAEAMKKQPSELEILEKIANEIEEKIIKHRF